MCSFDLPYWFFPVSLLLVINISAQQPPPRDPQAVAVLQQSLRAMGGTVPRDSVAAGAATLVAGSSSVSATIRIRTRGFDQSSEHVQTAEGRRELIYSRGRASEIEGSTPKRLSLERAATSLAPDSPLILIADSLNNPDSAYQSLGLELFAGSQVHHVRTWNSFSSNPSFQPLAEFSVRDLWIDAASGLLRKISYLQRDAGGAAPQIPIEVVFSEYQNVGGILYPFLIEKSINGTPWARITVQYVIFNVSLSDADFPLQ